MNNPWLSIIIPVLNEEKFIGSTLSGIQAIFKDKEAEIIVVDGGSRDRTREISDGFPRVTVLSSRPGRGPQMNRGASAAGGTVLLFLHADIELPGAAGVMIGAALAESKAVGGFFKVKTVISSNRSRFFKLLMKTADWRSRFTRYPYGDQAIFVKRAVFEDLGGFKDYPIMEDLEFSRRLYRTGKIIRVAGTVKVSGRRWEKNIIRNFIKLKTLPLLFRLGVHPEKLVRFYRDIR
jgi:rSAM/selenodomain-associated transferase 2